VRAPLVAVPYDELESFDEVFYGPADFLAKSALTGGASNSSFRPFLRQ
jgi:hypothetical protein